MQILAPNCPGSIAILATEKMAPMAKNVCSIIREAYKDTRFFYADLPTKVFPNGELYPNLIDTRVKNMDIFLFHDLREPDPNINLINLYLAINTLTLATVNSITLVLPYLCYSRQDRKDQARAPISARAIADLLQVSSKVERVITMDMHSDQGQGFFKIPVDNLYGSIVLSRRMKAVLNNNLKNVIVVAPDKGAATRAGRFAKFCKHDLPILILDKRRDDKGIEILKFSRNLKGKTVILYDDEIASGDTSITAAKAILKNGAKKVYVVATHWIGCPKDGSSAEEKFRKSGLEVFVTNTNPQREEYLRANPWLQQIPIDSTLAYAIHQSSLIGGSISEIFKV